ncbi:MAG: D-alanine--D-alanine ligase A [Bacteroidetes bacterium GWE2_29_8]|nr:MAG: D-alanine--D-alanine ligase A [Bacteroidetes bacterium GWE2_29_8]OFY16432.1 MAG: D-alanine--D-alanine ligase A [Bacteroidetes bacterium GWF2_29_10]
MKKKVIAVITGGNSTENEISLKSANVVFENIDNNSFEKYLIDIRGNDWIVSLKGNNFKIDKNDFSLTLDKNKIFFDCAYIIIHGNPGENGKLQGYFDMLSIPYTNCNCLTSSITFNKSACKSYLSTFDVNLAKSISLKKNEIIDIEKIIEKVSLPCFVKPAEGGSSVGISKVEKKEELKAAINLAYQCDNQIIIEEYIAGRELTCGIFCYNGEIVKFPVTEIISQNKFFDYEAKYFGKSLEVTPAEINDTLKEKCQTTAAYIYNALNCKGICRVDFICDKNEKLWFLEINTVPGMSAESIIPQQAKELGLSFPELCSMTINEALKDIN